MTDLSAKIYSYLCEHPHVSMTDLEMAVGVRARGLQSEGNEPGPFRLAIGEIYRETGAFVFSRSGAGGGVMLTHDRELARRAGQRLASAAWHTRDLAEAILATVELAERKEAIKAPFTLTP